MMALYFGRLRHRSFRPGADHQGVQELPDMVRRALQCHENVQRVAEKYAGCNNFLTLRRQFNFPTALEGC